jgi:hypothetical protein
MALSVVLVPNGLAHAITQGQIDVGPGYGQVPAIGAGQLLKLLLPFGQEIINKPGYEDQFYVLPKPLDANSSNYRLDAVQFETDPTTGQSVLRLLVDITAAPADVQIWLETHHSTGR